MLSKIVNGKTIPLTNEEIEEIESQNLIYEENLKKEKLSQPISMAQCQIQLSRSGILSTVENYIENSTNVELKIAWKTATRLSRDHALFTEASVALGLSESEIDDMYLAALDIDIV